MKIFKAEFPVIVHDDTFMPGDCKKCPLKRVEGHETAMRTWEEKTSCSIGYASAVCPLRIMARKAASVPEEHHGIFGRFGREKEHVCPRCGAKVYIKSELDEDSLVKYFYPLCSNCSWTTRRTFDTEQQAIDFMDLNDWANQKPGRGESAKACADEKQE